MYCAAYRAGSFYDSVNIITGKFDAIEDRQQDINEVLLCFSVP